MKTLTLLTLLLSGVAHADDGQLLVKFRNFSGKGCAEDKSDRALFVDRYSASKKQADEPWRELHADQLSGALLSVPLSGLPTEDNGDPEVYFRYYALHDIHHADHYISAQHLSRRFAQTLPLGQPVVRKFPTKGRFEGKSCDLELEITRIGPAPVEDGGEGAGGTGTAR